MDILAVSGSLRHASASTALLMAIVDDAAGRGTARLFGELHLIPPFNPDHDSEPAPPAVANWRAQLKSADAVVFSSPEYAHGVPGVLKNALDWVVGSGELYEKRVAIVQPSQRGEFAVRSLSETLSIMGTRLMPAVVIDIPCDTATLGRKIREFAESLEA
jgi:chromate reductase